MILEESNVKAGFIIKLSIKPDKKLKSNLLETSL